MHSGPDRGVFRFFFLRFISKILLNLTRLHYETTFKTHMDAFFIPIFEIETLEFSYFRRCFVFCAVPRYPIIFGGFSLPRKFSFSIWQAWC